MPKLLTNLQDHARTIVYEMIVAWLKADPVLSVTVDPYSWTTYIDDDAAIGNVPNDHRSLPAIQLTPYGTRAPALPTTQTLQGTPFWIQATVVVAGHDARDLLNFWGALEAAIFTGDGSRVLSGSIRDALAAAGTARGRKVGSLSTITLVAPEIKAGTDANQQPWMAAEGAILADMYVPK